MGERTYGGSCVLEVDAVRTSLRRVFNLEDVDRIVGRLKQILPKSFYEEGKPIQDTGICQRKV